MALTAGTRFGPYEIAESIGAGGMGEVYRATDTTLERDVAIKVLPASFADDPGRVERFEREAKTLAALNHPNIAQIYGLERFDGTTALVMELVEGRTLEDQIAKRPLPADEALGIANQIADALEAAHSQNIIHRDLKPANIKLRSDGTVKVLDFGIAKAFAPENLTSGPQSPIMTTPATQVGVILGTAAYMSPEQAKGKAVDQRTDIWAFGCVLYEMLTGQLAFGAEDVPTTLARVIANDTNLDSLPATVSPAVRRTVELCLRKDPRRRLHAMGDVRLALEGEFESAAFEVAHTVPSGRYGLQRVASIGLAALLAGAAVAGGAWSLWPDPATRPVNRFAYALPEGHIFRNTGRRVVALSPDGRQFVYNAQGGLYVREMSALEARQIAGTERLLVSPVFSPDSQEIAFYDIATNQLKRIAISGGAPVVIADSPLTSGGLSWAADGTLFFANVEGISRVSANGGTPDLIIPTSDVFVDGPQLLPGNDLVLFAETSGTWDLSNIVIQSISTGDRTVVVHGGSDARYLPTGHLIYALGDGLFAVRFDLSTLEVSGGAVPLVQGVMRSSAGQSATANYGISDDGTLIYVKGAAGSVERSLVWVDREGREEPINAIPRTYTYPRISPDGSKLALDIRDQELDIWIWDFRRETLTRLTFDPGEDEFPVWSPDGKRIAFSSSRGGGSTSETDLYWRAADGTGTADRLAEFDGQIFPSSFLPDASALLVRTTPSGNADDLSIVRLGGEGDPVPLVQTAFEERDAEISPDGRWMAYVSNDSGNDEIYVRPYPDVDSGRWQVSTSGGVQPLWSRDGQELFYRNGEALIAVRIETDESFSAGNPQILFEGPYAGSEAGPFNSRSYDVSLQGDRFLMIKPLPQSTAQPEIIVVENWFDELNRLAPPTP